MRKVLLVLVALMVVLSGVAMVSAYEAHMVNVKVHVENALNLSNIAVTNFGTVFPEEWIVYQLPVRMSTSFCALTQQRMTGIDFKIYMEEKPGYGWLGDAIYLQWGSLIKPANASAMINNWTTQSTPPTLPLDTGITGTLIKVLQPDGSQTGTGKNLWVGLDVPVFEGYHNADTDVPVKPSGLDHPTVIIGTGEDRYPENIDDGVDLGVHLKFQVTRIFKP